MEPIPRLERTDGKPIKDDELKRYGFNITIDSVSYDTPVDMNTIRCAVLLNINFDVADAVLAYAVVPLTTGTKYEHISTEGNNEDYIRISGYLPESTEWVQTRRLIGTKDTSATPNLALSVLSNSASLSGVGVNKHLQVDDPIMISLRPMMMTPTLGRPIQLNWEFENKDGPFYPPSLKVLVVVEKQREANEVFFPFVLKLRKELRIKVRGVKHHFRGVFPQFLFNRNSDGWNFRIKGNFKPALAKTALKDAAQVVGLHVATKEWFKAQRISA